MKGNKVGIWVFLGSVQSVEFLAEVSPIKE